MELSELPISWSWVPLKDLLSEPLVNGRSVKTMEGGFPVLRLTAIKEGKIDLRESKEGQWSADQAAPFLVHEGDFLLSRGNGSKHLVGRGGVVRSSAVSVAFPDTMIRVRPNPDLISVSYLRLLWDSPVVRRQIEARVRTTAGIYKINQAILEVISLPLPPLAEQYRIVQVLEEQLSRLANARKLVGRASKLARRLPGRFVAGRLDELAQDDSLLRPLGELVASSQGGWSRGQRHLVPANVGTPYLKMNNITSNGDLDLDQVVCVEADAAEQSKFGLNIGEVLFNSKNSAELVGKSAVVDERIQGWVFNENITRILFEASIIPEFAVLQLNTPRFRQRAKGKASTNVAAIYMRDLKRVPFLVPSLSEQRKIVDHYRILCDQSRVAERYMESIEKRAESLRRRLLSAAFKGQLVAQDSADEHASILIARIASECQEIDRNRSRRQRKREPSLSRGLSQSTGSGVAPFVPAPSPAPTHALQQEFDL
ncbi:restriction endonuclease subunit S [Streptomyces sp. NPDC020377]|uniref:restriction endonuclease subunit S n=1 Tax=Streptomyces sp. NPDC020377 TaxID=3365070 RepID=UPI0037B01B05